MRVPRRSRREQAAYRGGTLLAFRKRVVQLHEQALHELRVMNQDAESGENSSTSPDGTADAGDRAFAAAQWNDLAIQRVHLVAYVRRLEAALRRIEEGRYGRCVDCGVRIDKVRLEALPETDRCGPCQRSRPPVL